MTPISRRTFKSRAYAPTIALLAQHEQQHALVTIDQPIKAVVKVKEAPGELEVPSHPHWEQAVRDLAHECDMVCSGTVTFTTAYPYTSTPHLATSAAVAAVQALSLALEQPLHPDKIVNSRSVPHPEVVLGGYITGTPISSDPQRHHLVTAHNLEQGTTPTALKLTSAPPPTLTDLASASPATALTADISEWMRTQNIPGQVIGNDQLLLVFTPVENTTVTSMSNIAVTLRKRLGEQWAIQVSKTAPTLS